MSPAVDLRSFIPAARLARYEMLVTTDLALKEFYEWSEALSFALFADIGRLEVSMRSAMAQALVNAFGWRWYDQTGLFDDDAAASIRTARKQGGLRALERDSNVSDETLEGKLVASFTFGFWTKILGKGSYATVSNHRTRRIYDTLLWKPALVNAFNGAARAEVQRAATRVRVARNRVAHHEHIAWGIPMPGQADRRSVSNIYADLLRLADYLNPELAVWLEEASQITQLVDSCPVDRSQLDL